jgi:molybdenum cofactor cytidylyltransferase
MGGRPKCLIRVDGQTLLMRLLGALTQLQPRSVVLVLGHHATAIERALTADNPQIQPETLVNPEPGDDPASSLRLGLQALPADTGTVMVLLADQPLLNTRDLEEVLQAFTQRPVRRRVLCPMVDSTPGHPVLLEMGVAHDLLTEAGVGLKQWRLRHPATVEPWNTTNTHYIRDVDTPSQLESLQQEMGGRWEMPE